MSCFVKFAGVYTEYHGMMLFKRDYVCRGRAILVQIRL
jgi:hypothetical protein